MATTRRTTTKAGSGKQKNPGGGRPQNATPPRGKGKAPPGVRNAMAEKSEMELRLAGAAGRDPNDARMRARKIAK